MRLMFLSMACTMGLCASALADTQLNCYGPKGQSITAKVSSDHVNLNMDGITFDSSTDKITPGYTKAQGVEFGTIHVAADAKTSIFVLFELNGTRGMVVFKEEKGETRTNINCVLH